MKIFIACLKTPQGKPLRWAIHWSKEDALKDLVKDRLFDDEMPQAGVTTHMYSISLEIGRAHV